MFENVRDEYGRMNDFEYEDKELMRAVGEGGRNKRPKSKEGGR